MGVLSLNFGVRKTLTIPECDMSRHRNFVFIDVMLMLMSERDENIEREREMNGFYMICIKKA